MEKTKNHAGFTRQLKDSKNNLEEMTSKICHLQNRLKKIAGILDNVERHLEILDAYSVKNSSRETAFSGRPLFSKKPYSPCAINNFRELPSNIILFPDPNKDDLSRRRESRAFAPFPAKPGSPLPPEIPDYRPHLQRDGLILLAWDKRMTEKGELYTAYWVTSAGIPRFYASRPLPSKDFPGARPHHKSYAAEDGIEFYGQDAPACLVHVAPELMKSNPMHRELRHSHIKMLKQMGSVVDFDYKYLLKTDKDKSLPSKKTAACSQHQAG